MQLLINIISQFAKITKVQFTLAGNSKSNPEFLHWYRHPLINQLYD